MKKLAKITLVLFALSIAFVSCKKDDNKDGSADTPSASSALVGVWNGVTSQSKSYENGVLVDERLYSSGNDWSLTLTFKPDGSFVSVGKFGEDASTDEGTYSVEDNLLKYTLNDGETGSFLFTITANKLTLFADYEEKGERQDGEGNTETVTYKSQTTQVFEKQ